MRGSLALAIAVLGLGCQEPVLPPPPIGASGGYGGPPLGGQASGPDGDTSGGLDSGSTSSSSGATTGGTVPLLSGQLLDGAAGLLPLVCYVRLHRLESLDRGSGLPVESVYEAQVMVRALPQAYAIVSVPDGLVGPGDSIYVTTICDVDGDGIPDNLGGYHPGVPVEPVLLPGTEIDLVLDVLF